MLKSLTRIAIVLSFASAVFAGYDEELEAAKKLGAAHQNAEALAAFMKAAQSATNEPQVCDSLRQAAIYAAVLNRFDQAMALARKIPVAPLSKSCQLAVLSESRKYKELLEQFKNEDFAAWPKTVSGDAFRMRGEAAQLLRDGKQAVADLTRAADLVEDGYYRDRSILALGNVYKDQLKDESKAIETYARVSNGMPSMKCNACWLTADIYLRQNQPAKALAILDQIDISKSGGDTPLNVLRSRGQALAALNRRVDAIAAYRAALKIEGTPTAVRQQLESAIEPFILADPSQIILAAKGKTDYQIVIPDSAPSAEIGRAMTNIAKLVQTAFATNGFAVDVVPEAKRNPEKPGLFLGDTAFARSHGVNVATFPDWRYAHKRVGRDVIVAGRDQPCPVPLPPTWIQNGWGRNASSGMDRLGTSKAAADFLRQYAGVRFLLPGGETGIEFLPTPVIAVPADLNVVKIPALQYFFWGGGGNSFYEVANNWFPLVDMSLPSHSWPTAIPAKNYGETHPEYFALISGKRYTKPGDQYCISNPDVQELIYKELLGRADQGYEAVKIAQPDGFQPCQCEACNKLFATGDDWGEKIWILHRNLAERLLKERPGKKVVLMSYGRTWNPPKSFKQFPADVIVDLTHHDPVLMKEWSACKVPGGYGAYTYTFLGGYTPTQTPLALEKYAKYLFELKVKGIFIDGFYGNYGLMGPSFYVYGRMFDDPAHLQAKDLLEEFYEGAFREAATPMRRFFDTLYHAVQFSIDAKWSYQDVYGHQRTHTGDSMKNMTFAYSPDVLKDLETYLGQAERLAPSEKVKRRLALVRLEFDRLRHIVTVGHLWNAFRVDPDPAVRERLLQAVDDWNNFLKIMYDDGKGGRLKSGMRRNVIPGWPELMPFLGHSHHAVALTVNNYAGNYQDTPLNWNTAEMRKTALATARRLAVKPADGTITLDAPDWNTSEAGTFSALPGDSTPVTRKTSIRMLYDKTQVYLRVESELPGTLKDFAPVVKDGQPTQAESLDIAIDPFGAREKFYHFIVGPQAQPRYQAAHGFIADTLHPLYGKDDPGWQGSWTYETRLEPEKNRWLALLTIPYKTLGVEPPAVGALWRGNIIRLHVAAPDRLERSAWSATAQNKGGHDQNAFGDLVFDDASGSAGAGKAEASPLRKGRENLYKQTFEIPPEWKALPNLLPVSAWGPWRFHADPADKGVKENWFSKDLADTGWTKMQVPAFWAETDAGDIQGYGWYRVAFTVPADWKGKTVRLLFGAVDEQAWVYVNGTLAGEHSAESEKVSALQLWDVPFAVEVKPELLTYGGTNVLAVRVHNSAMNGGIWRPVLAQALGNK